MAPLTFGTDGVRGVANTELTPELVLSLGRAAARVLGPGPWLVGRDTRISGPFLGAALAAGLAAEGASVVDVGVLPTPAVAAACVDRDLPGAMISASHNPFPDNGVKLFAPGGRKLSDTVEAEIEVALHALDAPARSGAAVGVLSSDVDGALVAYEARLLAALDGRTLDGMRIVLDCANGSASTVAGDVFRRAGAGVTVLHAAPDGININDGCGSTHPESLQAAVRAAGGHAIGLAFDGDADRVLAVAEDGSLVDGDEMLALTAIDLRDRERLAGNAVVVTVMSNLGFKQAMRAAGIDVVETKVGDRYVLEALAEGGYALGGEQSGHIIHTTLSSTGDGVLTGLLLADLVRRSGRTLRALATTTMRKLPQVLVNVRVASPNRVTDHADVVSAVRAVEARLGSEGRVLLRPSGTEPLVRVMIEAPTAEEAREVADELAGVVTRALG
ncbi:MAG TPA: phosphoglucosamine mutase [Acidimicrobiales bacterium]|nr:phosphoglucosamine mutase [Acidimicrobiales bacterium]